MTAPPITPERLMQLGTGHWAAMTVGTAMQFRLFTHLEHGHKTVDALAREAGISLRGAQVLLDGLVGLGVVKVSRGEYSNADDTSQFWVEGKPTYMGAMVAAVTREVAMWASLPEVIKTGKNAENIGEITDNPFWAELVTGIAPLAIPTAKLAAERLHFAGAGAAEVLDVGGGSGVFAATLLLANPKAKATQLDWPTVNGVAREYVGKLGVGDRFSYLDGDFHTVDFGHARYDVGVYSNIAHQESPESNISILKRFRGALKPGGTLVISDFVQDDDRSGPPFALLFHVNMALHTPGATYRDADYRAWLAAADFKEVTTEKTHGPSTLIFAR